jgi:hypothetical protein
MFSSKVVIPHFKPVLGAKVARRHFRIWACTPTEGPLRSFFCKDGCIHCALESWIWNATFPHSPASWVPTPHSLPTATGPSPAPPQPPFSRDLLPPQPPDRSIALFSRSAATCNPPSGPLIPYLQGGVPRTLHEATVLTASQSLYQQVPDS